MSPSLIKHHVDRAKQFTVLVARPKGITTRPGPAPASTGGHGTVCRSRPLAAQSSVGALPAGQRAYVVHVLRVMSLSPPTDRLREFLPERICTCPAIAAKRVPRCRVEPLCESAMAPLRRPSGMGRTAASSVRGPPGLGMGEGPNGPLPDAGLAARRGSAAADRGEPTYLPDSCNLLPTTLVEQAGPGNVAAVAKIQHPERPTGGPPATGTTTIR